MVARRRRPRGARRRPARSPSPTTPLRRRRRSHPLHQAWPPGLVWPPLSPHLSPCTPGMASPPPAAPRQRSALLPERPARPHLLSMPPASPTQSHPQLPRRQPSVWRACRPRAPARPPLGSFWSHQSCPRVPQSLLSTPPALLGPPPASLPTPPCPPLGSWCSPAWPGCLKPALALPPVRRAARVPSQPSPAVALPPPLSCWLETRALCLLLEPHPRSSR